MKYFLLILLFCVVTLRVVGQHTATFIRMPAGRYTIGAKGNFLNPLRTISIKAISIATTETTNQQFDAFVRATHYVTDAERYHNANIFEPGLEEFKWIQDSTAYWRFPNGIRNGGIEQKMNHPVTSISYNDILAYCKWAGVRLPTLEEWEIAARAGSKTEYFWGSDKKQIGKYANVWHGRDHLTADTSDGYMYTAPVGSFTPNAWGLYDVYGNVFEFCDGQLVTDKNDKLAHARGGSWWCSKNACSFFNSVDIGTVNKYASFSNQGFRVVSVKGTKKR